jgi:predicted nucleic acid-binding protein
MLEPLFEPVVADTDVVSYIFDQDPVRSPRYEPLIEGRTVYLPFVVMGELLYRVEHRQWGPARRARLMEFLQDYVVIQSAPDVIENWARLRVDAGRSGRVVERQDAWIAAVALTLQLPLLPTTRVTFRASRSFAS